MKEHLSVRPDQTFTTFFSAMLSVSKVLERKPESTTFSSKVSALFTGCSNKFWPFKVKNSSKVPQGQKVHENLKVMIKSKLVLESPKWS